MYLLVQLHLVNDPELEPHARKHFGPARPAAQKFDARTLHDTVGAGIAPGAGKIVPEWVGDFVVDCTAKTVRYLRGHSSSSPLLFWSWQRGSSDVDWCEGNYTKSKYIAEFYNTISNILFFVLPPIAVFKYSNYALYIDAGIHVVFLLLVIIGAGSGYFHATLSLSGQLFDEWAIIWTGAAGAGMFCPQRFIPRNALVQGSRFKFKFYMLGLAGFATALSLVWPVLNAFMLLAFAIPICYVFTNEVRLISGQFPAVKRLGFASFIWWMLAIVCWINDRAFCEFWKKTFGGTGGGEDGDDGTISYPQLHAWWHVLIVIASYTTITCAAFWHALAEASHTDPRIGYWPSETWVEMGIPYVKIKVPRSESKVQ